MLPLTIAILGTANSIGYYDETFSPENLLEAEAWFNPLEPRWFDLIEATYNSTYLCIISLN